MGACTTTVKQARRAVELLNMGRSYAYVEEVVGVSRIVAYKAWKASGTYKNRSVVSEKLTNRVRELYEDGRSQRQVARMTGVPQATVQNITERLGINRSRRDGARLWWERRRQYKS